MTSALRICDVCGGVDNHPRHIFVVEGSGINLPVNTELVKVITARDDLDIDTKTALLADLHDTGVQTRHLDCCAATGCPAIGTESDCAIPAATGKTGAELLAHLTGGN